jgi:hypothetical protein
MKEFANISADKNILQPVIRYVYKMLLQGTCNEFSLKPKENIVIIFNVLIQ